MPVYSYHCKTCGTFDSFRSLETRNETFYCPDCREVAARVIEAPRLALMNPAKRHAHSTNERSQHAPRISNGHTCGSDCGHAKGTAIRKNRLRQTKFGEAQTPKLGARPWMLGH